MCIRDRACGVRWSNYKWLSNGEKAPNSCEVPVRFKVYSGQYASSSDAGPWLQETYYGGIDASTLANPCARAITGWSLSTADYKCEESCNGLGGHPSPKYDSDRRCFCNPTTLDANIPTAKDSQAWDCHCVNSGSGCQCTADQGQTTTGRCGTGGHPYAIQAVVNNTVAQNSAFYGSSKLPAGTLNWGGSRKTFYHNIDTFYDQEGVAKCNGFSADTLIFASTGCVMANNTGIQHRTYCVSMPYNAALKANEGTLYAGIADPIPAVSTYSQPTSVLPMGGNYYSVLTAHRSIQIQRTAWTTYYTVTALAWTQSSYILSTSTHTDMTLTITANRKLTADLQARLSFTGLTYGTHFTCPNSAQCVQVNVGGNLVSNQIWVTLTKGSPQTTVTIRALQSSSTQVTFAATHVADSNFQAQSSAATASVVGHVALAGTTHTNGQVTIQDSGNTQTYTNLKFKGSSVNARVTLDMKGSIKISSNCELKNAKIDISSGKTLTIAPGATLGEGVEITGGIVKLSTSVSFLTTKFVNTRLELDPGVHLRQQASGGRRLLSSSCASSTPMWTNTHVVCNKGAISACNWGTVSNVQITDCNITMTPGMAHADRLFNVVTGSYSVQVSNSRFVDQDPDNIHEIINGWAQPVQIGTLYLAFNSFYWHGKALLTGTNNRGIIVPNDVNSVTIVSNSFHFGGYLYPNTRALTGGLDDFAIIAFYFQYCDNANQFQVQNNTLAKECFDYIPGEASLRIANDMPRCAPPALSLIHISEPTRPY